MPNRFLKESIRTSKTINALTDFQFRVWAYLITYVDDFGRGSAEPDIIKGFVFPRRKSITEASIKTAIDDLASMGLIRLYIVDGDSYLYFPNWSSHQNTRATTSKYPAPTDENTCMQMSADENMCNHVLADAPVTRNSLLDTRYSNNVSRSTPRKGAGNSVSPGFERFWTVYPRKVSKQVAIKAWNKSGVADSQALTDTIVADVERRVKGEWAGKDVQYIPHPATYLNQRRWEDEPSTTTPQPSPSPEPLPAFMTHEPHKEYSPDERKAMYREMGFKVD